MIDLAPAALAILRAQHGVAAVRQLAVAGVDRDRRRRLVDSGVLIVERPNVLRLATAPAGLESRCVALCLAHPSGFVTGPSAARLLDLQPPSDRVPIHFCVRHGNNLCEPGITLRQSTRIEGCDVNRLECGITVASCARLAFDLGADLSPGEHLSVVEQMVARRLCTVGDLLRMARRLCHPTRPGSGQFAELVATVSSSRRAA